MAENLLVRVRHSPYWASKEIARLRELVKVYVDPSAVRPEHKVLLEESDDSPGPFKG